MRPPDRTPIIVGGWRTPFTTPGGPQSTLTAADLAATTLTAAHQQLPATTIDAVLLGNCRGPGGNLARVSALAANLGNHTIGITLDTQCGSGLTAITTAADMITAGSADVILAGGVESPSTEPLTSHPGTPNQPEPTPYTRADFAPPGHPNPDMGPAADAVAEHYRISRADQDNYALGSWQRIWAAQSRGVLAEEITPTSTCAQDQRPRNMTAATLHRLRPAFAATGTSTAGNSCAHADGAAVVAITSAVFARTHHLPGVALVAAAHYGGDPAFPGAAAGPAVTRALTKVGWSTTDLDRLEVTEAFAAQVLATSQHLGWAGAGTDRDRVNPDGGAIALGHPWGASGAALAVRVWHAARRAEFVRQRGALACAIAGGLGVAAVTERFRP